MLSPVVVTPAAAVALASYTPAKPVFFQMMLACLPLYYQTYDIILLLGILKTKGDQSAKSEKKSRRKGRT